MISGPYSAQIQRALAGLVTNPVTWTGAATFTSTVAVTGAITQGGALNLGTTSTDGIVTANTTAAAAGAQQISPRTRWRGYGWKTDATAASQSVDFFAEVLPVQGTAAPTGRWRVGTSINGGAVTYPLTVFSAGSVQALTEVECYAGAAGSGFLGSLYVGWKNGTLLRGDTNGKMNITNNAVTAGVGLDVLTDGILKVRTRAQTGYATVDALAYQVSGTPGVSFSGAITNLTIVNGIVTAAS